MSCCGSLFVNLGGGGGGGTVNTGVLQIAGGVALDSTLRFVEDQNGTDSPLKLSTDEVGIDRTIALSAGSTNVRLINETYTINNSGAQTGTLTGIFLNATETGSGLNGMAHNLMDLQVGGVSKFRVLPAGGIVSDGTSIIPIARMSFINNSDNSVTIFSFANTTGATTFGGSIFRLGGTTNSFSAIKGNGPEIDFRLADDNGYCKINAGGFTSNIAGSKVIEAIAVSGAMGLGFYNAPAIIQPVTGGAAATYASVSGSEIKENDTFDGYTVGGVIKALRNLGLLA